MIIVQIKIVPEAPGGLDVLEEARQAVPLVPRTEGDCCARLMDRIGLDSRDAAREWLTFLRALGLVEVGERGFSRTDRDSYRDRNGNRDRDSNWTSLGEAFRERIYAVEDVLTALEDSPSPLDPPAVFDRVRNRVPPWERNRHADWADVWTERVRRILDWAVLFGLAQRRDGGYKRSHTSRRNR